MVYGECRVERGVQVEALLDDGDEDVDRDGNPDLRLHRVLRRAVELLDPKMLLDPLEEEFHLPAAFVERADGGGRKREVVGDEDQRLAGLGVLEADAPQKFGVILTGVEAVQGDGLVANDAGRAIRRRRIDAMSIDVRLGTRDEEGPGLVQHIKAGKVDVATIHDVDGSGFRQEHIEGMNVVQLAIRDVDKTRNVAPQVEQRVHLHRRLGGAEVRPRKDRQAQSDGRRVQGVDGIGQVQPQFFVDVQRPRLGDEPLGQRRMDTPVAPFVGIGQRRAPDRLAEAHVIEFRCVDREAGLDVAQAFPVGQLGEGHGPVLLGAGKRPDPVIAAIPVDDPRESSPWQEVHELSEQGLAGVHEHLLGETPKSAPSNSNRHHAFLLQTPQKSWLSKPAPLS